MTLILIILGVVSDFVDYLEQKYEEPIDDLKYGLILEYTLQRLPDIFNQAFLEVFEESDVEKNIQFYENVRDWLKRLYDQQIDMQEFIEFLFVQIVQEDKFSDFFTVLNQKLGDYLLEIIESVKATKDQEFIDYISEYIQMESKNLYNEIEFLKKLEEEGNIREYLDQAEDEAEAE